MDPHHIYVCPSKYILFLMQETRKLLCELAVKALANFDNSAQLLGVYLDLYQFFNWPND